MMKFSGCAVPLVVAGALLSPAECLAQTACPIGTVAGSLTCGPTPTYGGSGGVSQSPAPRPVPIGEWIKTWGAISVAASTGDVGYAVGKLSEQEAKDEALKLCEQNGASDCRGKLVAYRNQCAALAWPLNSGGDFSIGFGADVKDASAKSIKACKGASPDSCKVVYSACSEQLFRHF